MREFMHVDDCAKACLFLMERYNEKVINIGTGIDVTIKELATKIQKLLISMETYYSTPKSRMERLENVECF